jgi:RNA polymerase sigma factor (sigma-70 family)
MRSEQRRILVQDVQTLFDQGAIGILSDRQLLERFTSRGAEGAELAFAALVERHGPMVLRVCRGMLRDPNDVQDAFQATFLVLLRRAGSLWVGDSLGAWLLEVARRTSRCARTAEARRRRHERLAAERGPRPVIDAVAPDDLAERLHEEVGRLPPRYREAVVLCLLEGLTHAQAERRIGCPVGTVQSRLARGRQRLRSRLLRRGLAPAAGGLSAAIELHAAPLIPPPASLVERTTRAAVALTIGGGTVPAPVKTLLEGVLTVMFMTRLKMTAAALLVLGGLAAGAGVMAQQDPSPSPSLPTEPTAAPKAAVAPVLNHRETDVPRGQILNMPAPSADEWVEIMYVDRKGVNHHWTLTPHSAPNGEFIAATKKKTSRLGGIRAGDKILCEIVQITAPEMPGIQLEGLVVPALPREVAPPTVRTPGVAIHPHPVPSAPAPAPAPTPDVNQRLSEVERKLDLLLNTFERDRTVPSPLSR